MTIAILDRKSDHETAAGIGIVNLGIHLNSHAGATPSDSQSTSSRWSLTAAWHRSTHSAIPGEFSIKEIPWSSGTSWRRLGQKSHRTQRAWSRISRPFLMSLESCMKMKAKNKGCLVPDLAFRSGRRHLSKKHAGEKRKSNIKSRDTIATQMMPKVHFSLEEAVEILYRPRGP